MTTILSIIRHITDECWLRICVGISSSYESNNNNDDNDDNVDAISRRNSNTIVSIILKDGSSAYLLELILDIILIFASYKISIIFNYYSDDDDVILKDNENNHEEQKQLDINHTTNHTVGSRSNSSSMINLEYAIIYFSIINSWYLFIHHYSSRFTQQHQDEQTSSSNSINNTRLHSILLWVYIFGMILSVQSLTKTTSNFNTTTNTTNNNIFEQQQFSLSMVLIRITIFILIFRIGCYVPRATATCALMSFFLSDSGLCYGLAMLSSDSSSNSSSVVSLSSVSVSSSNKNNNEDAKLFLWGFSCWMELLIDFFIAISLSENLQLSYNLKYTLDHFANVLLVAPLGSFTIQLISRTLTTTLIVINNWIYVIESFMLLLLFGLLFYSLKDRVYETAIVQTKIYQSFLFVVLKILGLSIWTVTSYLILLLPLPRNNNNDNDDDNNSSNNMSYNNNNDDDYYYYDHHLGGSIGNVLIWFFVFRLFGRRQHIFQDVLWIVTCCSIKILSTYSNNNESNNITSTTTTTTSTTTTSSSTENNNTNDIYLSIYIILVGILNISESWTSLRSATVAATTTTPTTRATNNNERGEDEAGEGTRLLQPP